MSARRWLRRVAVAAVVLGGISVALGSYVHSDLHPGPVPEMEPVAGVGTLSAQQCRACHPDVYSEWAESRHSQSLSDPLYRAEFNHSRLPFLCERCHAPLKEQREDLTYGLWLVWPKLVPITWPNDRFDPLLREEGVTCVACHQREGSIMGPRGVDAVHPAKKADMRGPSGCQDCHVLSFDVLGKLERPVMDTVAEWEDYRERGGDKVCADCHMPPTDPRPVAIGGVEQAATNHRVRGPWDLDFVQTGIIIRRAEIEATGGTATVVIGNETGHRLPTAEPARYIELRLQATDAQGTVIATASERIERAVDQAKLVPLGPDSTIEPLGEREVQLSLGADELAGAQSLHLTVDFYLWDPAADVSTEAGLSAEQLRHRLVDQRAERGG
ncbi:MAG: hypothetical protein AAF799_43110 [Myxococcota bacterium]